MLLYFSVVAGCYKLLVRRSIIYSFERTRGTRNLLRSLYSKLHDDRFTEQNRTDLEPEPNQFTVYELVYILFRQIEYKRNYVGLALCISFIMCTFWLSVRFRMYEWLFGPCS